MAPKKPQNQKPISPDEKARRQLVREIKVLGNHINEPETRIHEYLELSDGSPGGEFAVGYAGSREEECLKFKFRDNGRVSRTTWQTSGHNGDPYDFKTTELSPEEATRVLTGLRDMLEERAPSAKNGSCSSALPRNASRTPPGRTCERSWACDLFSPAVYSELTAVHRVAPAFERGFTWTARR